MKTCDCWEPMVVLGMKLPDGKVLDFKVMADPRDPTKPLLVDGTVRPHRCRGQDHVAGRCFVCGKAIHLTDQVDFFQDEPYHWVCWKDPNGKAIVK